MDKILFKRLAWRFARAFASGAISTMILVNPVMLGGSWKELANWLVALAFAAVVGGITGVIQAADLYLRNKETET